MSFNRQNVIWQSKNGLWSIGFFECYPVNQGENHDPEWDVEYNLDAFSWASVGHATQDSASNAWKGANPGSCWVYGFSESDAIANGKFDDMAQAYLTRSQIRK